jgi:hypothetical protein
MRRAVLATAETRQAFLLALLRRDAQVWHDRTEIFALWNGPDDAIERGRKIAQRRKLIRQRDERIKLGMKVKKFALPTGAMHVGEQSDAFAAMPACVVCGGAVPLNRRRAGTCSPKCYRAWYRVVERKSAQRGMVNDSNDPQPCPDIRYSDRPAIPMPQNQTLIHEAPRGSERKIA